MNATGFSDDSNDTFVGNRSVEQDDRYYTYNENLRLDWTTIFAVRDIIFYVAFALGFPGNILSAIVWLRRHIATENPSATYLAALAITDLVFLIVHGVCLLGCNRCDVTSDDGWPCVFLAVSTWSTTFLEPLLVLSFSVVRLIAIRRPLQVCCIHFRLDSYYNSGTGHGMHVGNPTCKQKTLDVRKSVSPAQADGQYSPGCSVFVNIALF